MKNLELVLGTPECTIKSVVSHIVKDAELMNNWTSIATALDIPNAAIKILRQDVWDRKIKYSDLLHAILEEWVSMRGKNAELVMLILVIEEETRAVNARESIRLHFNLPVSLYDSISWENLPRALQVKAINNLHKLIPNMSIEYIKLNLKGIVLRQLIKGVPQTLPECLSYYVHRTVLTRNTISSDIFENCHTHIFLISGIGRYELSKFAKDKMTDNSTSQILQGNTTVRHITLDSPYHFDKICELTEDPAHWLHFDGRKLKWIQSRGGISTVQKFVDTSEDILHEKDFVTSFPSYSNEPICISDSPGMGKSVFLAEIGRRLVDLYPNRAVIFLAMGEFIKTIKDTDIKGLLYQTMYSPKKHGVSIELLLDGFDEVDSSEREFALELLGSIRTCCKSIRMWVTSRPHLLDQLERTLETFGFNIQPFSFDDQLQFLTCYWRAMHPDIKYPDKLTKFANHFLKTLKSTVKSKDSDIAGVPLQCLLIGDFFEEAASAFSSSEQLTSPTIFINSITELYKSMIHQKFQKGSWTVESAEGKTMMDMHARLSLQLIFPEQFEKLKHQFAPIKKEKILKIGILHVSNMSADLRFLHSSFAEYFVAWFVGDRLKNCIADRHFVDFFITVVLKCVTSKQRRLVGYFQGSHFVNDGITYFLNSLLDIHPKNTISFVFASETFNQRQNVYTNYFLIRNYFDICQDIAWACVTNDRLQIFKWVMKFDAFNVRKRGIFDNDLLFQSMHFASLELVKIVLEKFEEHRIFDADVQGQCLRIAVKMGRFSIVEFLIKERQLHTVVEELSSNTRDLLHDCVLNSQSDSPLQMDDKIQIIRMLSDINPALVDIKDGKNGTPLVTSMGKSC